DQCTKGHMNWRTILLIMALTAGCSGVRVPIDPTAHRIGDRLDDADALARIGRYVAARETYAAVLADPEELAKDRALLGLARLRLDPENGKKDERQAARYLDRVLSEYPDGCCAVEARTWRSLLRSTERLLQDIRRSQQDLEQFRRDLQRAQQETVRLRD